MTIDTNKPSISVIINTVDRAGPLRTLLRSLEHQSYNNFEVIVVVGPTEDNTRDVLSEYEGRIRILDCPTANLSRSRNIGLLASQGDIVAFVDDDAVPCYHWLEQYGRIIEDCGKDITGGAVWAAHPQFSVLQFRLGIYSALAEQEDVRSSWIEQIVPNGYGTRWIVRAPGGNLAARRESLLDIRGFDEFYEFVAEETDLALRIANSGGSVHPVREAPIYHFPATGRNRVAFTNKGRWWLRSRSRVYLGIKHGLSAGEPMRSVIFRNLRSALAHFPWYLSLLFHREFSLFDFLSMSGHEVVGAFNALSHGLFYPRQLIPSTDVEQAKKVSEPILKFKNQDSSKQPSVDPVSGYRPQITMPDQPLRLCLLSNTYPPEKFGGIARLTHLMAQGLFERGHTVHVITRGEREQVTYYDGAYVHQIPNSLTRYERYRHQLNLYGTLNYSHNVYDKVRQLILNDGIQIADSPLWQYEGLVTMQSGLLPVVIRLVTGLRQVTDIHSKHVNEFAIMGDLEQTFIEKADYLLPNTRATLNAIQKVYDIQSAESRCEIVPYGIIPAPDDQVRPFNPDLEHHPLTVLFVGRLEKRKGIMDLFEAIPQVLKQHPDVQFIIAGADNSEHDGFRMQSGMDYPTYFSNHFKDYLSNVKFMGMVSDEVLQNLYQSCDLFVAPSLYESFGLIYLEAMNFAKPVIGCNAGGIPEVIDHGETGIVVEPHAPKELAEAIISLLNSPDKLLEMGLAGRAQILDRFSYLRMAKDFEKIYRQVIHTYNSQFSKEVESQD
jgi:glycosyltransferase involved in cell wall biosynthesis/GT2 family glycosyltransferase